jgi:hypothetical protein
LLQQGNRYAVRSPSDVGSGNLIRAAPTVPLRTSRIYVPVFDRHDTIARFFGALGGRGRYQQPQQLAEMSKKGSAFPG